MARCIIHGTSPADRGLPMNTVKEAKKKGGPEKPSL
jgi:hypothetical protein